MNMKRILSTFLALTMMVGIFPATGLTVSAEGSTTNTITQDSNSATMTVSLTVPEKEPVSYIDADGTEKQTGTDYYNVREGMMNWGVADQETWYVVDKDVTIESRITVNGDVNLILCDGATLTASKGITFAKNEYSLTVYGQSGGTGALIANGAGNEAGIGGNQGVAGGNVTINGGNITATSAYGGAGIGGGDNGAGGNTTINGGVVNATGGNGAGIGGGWMGGTGNTIINGGTVTAVGFESPGIGYGQEYFDTSEPLGLTVAEGMTIVAGGDTSDAEEKTSVSDLNRWSCYIYIEKSEPLTAVTYLDDNGEQQTLDPTDYKRVKAYMTSLTEGWYVVNKNVTITSQLQVNGKVKLILMDGATLTVKDANISCAMSSWLKIYGQSGGTGELNVQSGNDHAIVFSYGSLTVNGGKLTANVGAGKTGLYGISGKLTINGGEVNAAGGSSGIFTDTGAVNFNGGTVTLEGSGTAVRGVVTVSGGSITATGGSSAIYSDMGFTVKDGTVIATSTSEESAAINAKEFSVTGGNVTVTNTGANGTGIKIGNNGTCAISGGTVSVTSTKYGIQYASYSGDPKLYINDGTVTIQSGFRCLELTGYVKLSIGDGLQTKAGDDDTADIVPIDTFMDYYPMYKWISVGKFHKHSFKSYALSKTNAENDTITATCTDDLDNCNLAESDYKATMTIVASNEGGGKATLTGNASDFGVTDADIKYTKDGQDITAEQITDTGFYKASITVGEKTAYITYGVNEVKKDTAFDAKTAHGDFTVPAVATANATVTIETTPDTGYELKAITVKKTDNSVVTSAVDGNKGTFTMPEESVTVSAEFKLHDYTITKSEMTNGSVTVSGTAKMGDTVSLTITPDTGYELDTLTVKDSENKNITVTNNSFTMPASDITVSATFKLHNYTITKSEMTNGSVSVAATAKMGDTVLLTVTPDAGYELDTLQYNNNTITADGEGKYKFTMPAADTNITATFKKRIVPVKLNVTENGTPCTAKLLTADDYADVPENFTRKIDDRFVISLTAGGNYDYAVKFDGDAAAATSSMTEFTAEEYKAYADYLKGQKREVPSQTDLFWVTMPGVANDKAELNIDVTFAEIKDFTVLYEPKESAETAWTKFTDSENHVYVAEMKHDLNVDGDVVWSVSLKSAFVPKGIAFATTMDDAKDATVTNCTAQTNTEWKYISDDKYVVIGGNAKAVAAVFADQDTGTEEFEIAVCTTDASGKVTTPGTVKAPAAPTAPDGLKFVGWRGFKYDAKGLAYEGVYSVGETVSVRVNTTLAAVWEPIVPTVNLNPNNGDDIITIDATYGDPVFKPENIEKIGFALENWTIGKSVTESGKFFSKGSPFDFSTGITDDLELNADWKHVHSYTCVPINYSAFGDALSAYYKYLPYLHVKFCSCLDVEIEAHTFQNGVCTGCGYTKPGATEAKLEVFYWKEGATSAWMAELPETVKVNEEVQVSAYWQIGDYQFSKWQYSTNNGETWYDLAADNMIGFIIPCSMQVRAIYASTIKDPQVSLSARNYVTEAQGYNWDSVLFQMEYKLPDGYSLVDAGIRMGDNDGISYYEMKEVKQTTGQKAAMAGVKLGLNLIPFVGGGLTGFATDMTMDALSDPEYYYAKRENSVLDDMTAATLSEYMLKSKPVNVEKYPPIYWESKVNTKSHTGSVNTLTPLSFIQKNNGNHYIYGMAYLTYKTPDGEIKTIYTEALPTTRDNIPTYTVKADPNGMTNTMPH